MITGPKPDDSINSPGRPEGRKLGRERGSVAKEEDATGNRRQWKRREGKGWKGMEKDGKGMEKGEEAMENGGKEGWVKYQEISF